MKHVNNTQKANLKHASHFLLVIYVVVYLISNHLISLYTNWSQKVILEPRFYNSFPTAEPSSGEKTKRQVVRVAW